jgi:hypothetical protein
MSLLPTISKLCHFPRLNQVLKDYRGRVLSYQLINSAEGGLGYTWSSITSQPEFMNTNMPLLIILADERVSGE